MKTIVRSVVLLAMLASNAFAAKWTPDGGTQQQAPKGEYVGKVTREAVGDKVTWKVTTDKGVLEIKKGEDGLTAAERETLDLAAAQNDKDNKVVIDKEGRVDSVSTG